MAENFIPSTATQTIGTPTKRWNNIYSTKIKTNDTFVNDRIITFSATVPDVTVSTSQYAPIIQNGLLLSFILAKYSYDKTLLLRIQSHPSTTDTNTVTDYRDIPYSDFATTANGLELTNYNLTNMTIPITGSGTYNAYLSFLYVTSDGLLKGKIITTPARVQTQ